MSEVPRGFLAIRFADEDRDNPRNLRSLLKNEFVKQIRKSAPVNATTTRDADIFFDADDLPAAPFEERSLQGIDLSTFSVAEVAHPSPNVYLELGEMMAERARFHMFWALDFDPMFNPDKLPKFIQNWPIDTIGYRISDYKERRKLVKAVLKRIQDPSILSGCPWDKVAGCGYAELQEEPKWVFCLYNSNVDVDDKTFKIFLSSLNNRLGITSVSQATLAAHHLFCDLCRKVRRSHYIVIDISNVPRVEKDNKRSNNHDSEAEATSYERGAALVAGFAYALRKNTMLTFCEGRGKTMAMLKGHPECVWNPSRLGEDLFERFREFYDSISLWR